MNKKYSFVENLSIVKKSVSIGVGIMITLFSCLDDVQASDNYVSSIQESQVSDCSPVICENVEIELSPNKEESTLQDKNTIVECAGGPENALEVFASSILENIRPLDEKFSKFVDDHFWELI